MRSNRTQRFQKYTFLSFKIQFYLKFKILIFDPNGKVSHLRPRSLISNHGIQKFFFAFLKMFLTSFIKTVCRQKKMLHQLIEHLLYILSHLFLCFQNPVMLAFSQSFCGQGQKNFIFFLEFLEKRVFPSLTLKCFSTRSN